MSEDKPKDKIESEDDLMFGYGNKQKEPIELLQDYLPKEDDWGAKTVIPPEHPHKVTALSLLPQLYPEIENFDSEIQEWIEMYEKRLTSVNGMSRDEFVRILVAISGGSQVSEEGKRSLLKDLVQPVGDND